MSSKEPVISLENIEVHFELGGFIDKLRSDVDTVKAVDGVSLEIGENDVVALVGESGCGKTTLGKTAVGLQRPTGGAIRYRGQDIWETKDSRRSVGDYEFEEIRRSLQIIHQDPGSSLNPHRTVMGQLVDPIKKWYPEMNPGQREENLFELLSRMGMKPPEDYANRYPHQLSGGEQQRVALGRALMLEPDLVLADEAVSALDVSLRVEMMDLMLELQDVVNTSYLFISHDLANARYLAGRADGYIGVMYLGNIVEIGPVDQIINDPQHPYTQILRWATPQLNPDLAKKAHEQEIPVREVDIPDPIDPPSGCHFHPRCPQARAICAKEEPELIDPVGEGTRAACYRADDNHEYWNSPSIDDVEEELTVNP